MSKVFFVTDVEGTGPDFGTHSMYQFASVPVLPDGSVLDGISYDLKLLSTQEDAHDPDTLQFLRDSQNITLETLITRPRQTHYHTAMFQFSQFIARTLKLVGANKPIFVSDNLAYDWGYIHTYFCRVLKENPFGYAGRNLPDISTGFYRSRTAWEAHRTTPHTHDALEDTLGNAGALSHMIREGLVME